MDEKIGMRGFSMRGCGKKNGAKIFWRRNTERIIKLVILILLIVIPPIVVKHNTVVKMEKQFEVRLADAVERTEQETREKIVSRYGTEEDSALRDRIDVEAKMLAKMLYPMQYNTTDGLKSACWCAINRVESKYYPNTIAEVCEQKSQWMGWDNQNPVTQKLYDIAYEQLALWHNGIHAISTDFLFLEWTPKEITLRTTFNGKGHVWYESDWESQQKYN